MAYAGPSPKRIPSAWSEAHHLVFLGFRVAWRSSISDLSMNTQLAERWEPSVTDSSADGRTLRLSLRSEGYAIRLMDGGAEFRMESEAAYERAITHSQELLEQLEGRRHPRVMSLDSQYLVPFDETFEVLVSKLGSALLNTSLAPDFGAQLSDLAYLADFQRGDMPFQLNVGPLRAHEVPRRVAAQNLKEIPDVAIFYGLTVRAAPRLLTNMRDLSESIFELGNLVARRLSV